MKIVIGRIINMLAVLILLFGHVSTVKAFSHKQFSSDKSLKFSKLELVDNVSSFLEDEEEEEDFQNKYITLSPFHTLEIQENITTNTSNLHFSKHKNEKNTSLPLWLEVRHILI